MCTSIIESGIDIPQANTLIVERADTFGLAQLYQIRGRVGRSRERAYAYLLYPSAAALTPRRGTAAVARSPTTPSSGAGFKIAMRDLEIRGAGNLLGDEQSGHVAALGFELYMQMLDEAVGGGRRTAPAPRRIGSRCASTSTSTRTSRRTTSPTSRPRSTCTAGSRAPARSPTWCCCARSSRIASASCPSRCKNLIALQQARIKLGQAGARAVTFRSGRLAVTPIELDSRPRQADPRRRSPRRCTSPASRSCRCGCPRIRCKRFPAVVKAADVLLAVTREARRDGPQRS